MDYRCIYSSHSHWNKHILIAMPKKLLMVAGWLIFFKFSLKMFLKGFCFLLMLSFVFDQFIKTEVRNTHSLSLSLSVFLSFAFSFCSVSPLSVSLSFFLSLFLALPVFLSFSVSHTHTHYPRHNSLCTLTPLFFSVSLCSLSISVLL